MDGTAGALQDKVTIDLNIARDCLESGRPYHLDAQALLHLARQGVVEIKVAPQGHRSDVPPGELERRLRCLFEGEGIGETLQVARVSDITYPSDTLYPGAFADGLVQAWDEVIATWKSHEGRPPGSQDRWYVETHLVSHRDVFLTNDRALRAMCQRLASEHGFPIRAMSTADYLQTRTKPRSP